MSVLKITNDNYDQEILHEDGTVLIDFYAEWCGPCRTMAPVIEEIAEELEGKVKVGKVNVDENEGLAMEYGVMNIPTFVVCKKGEVVKSFIGAKSKQEILNYLK